MAALPRSCAGTSGEYVVELNAYRYAPFRSPAGAPGVHLFAVSCRAYGNHSASAFLGGLKQLRPPQIGAMLHPQLPCPMEWNGAGLRP